MKCAVRSVALSVQQIHVTVIAQQVFELQGHAHQVLDLVRPLKSKGGTPLILHMKLPGVDPGPTVGPLNSKIEHIPVDLAKFVSGGSPPAGS